MKLISFLIYSFVSLFVMNKNMLKKNNLIFLKKEKTVNKSENINSLEYQPVEFVQSLSSASKNYFDLVKSGEYDNLN